MKTIALALFVRGLTVAEIATRLGTRPRWVLGWLRSYGVDPDAEPAGEDLARSYAAWLAGSPVRAAAFLTCGHRRLEAEILGQHTCPETGVTRPFMRPNESIWELPDMGALPCPIGASIPSAALTVASAAFELQHQHFRRAPREFWAIDLRVNAHLQWRLERTAREWAEAEAEPG